MRLDFRQGIARSRAHLGAPDFLTYNNTFSTVDVNITTPWLIATAAFKNQDYLIEERANQSQSWGPFSWDPRWGEAPPVVTYQLYWDINLATGAITKGYTPWAPTYGDNPPATPRIDQHWFDISENVMYVWDSAAWQQRCRVFAASFGPSTQVITEKPFFSQVGYNSTEVFAGYIVYGEDSKAIKLDDGTFLTSATDLFVNTGRYSSPINLEAGSTAMIAGEPIPAFSVITNSDLSEAMLASSGNVNRYPIGLALKEAALGEAVEFISEGVVYNDQWNWDFDAGKDIYCGANGTLYQGPPTLANDGELKIGTILSEVSILVHIDKFGLGGGGPAGMGPLERDVEVIGTSVGAIDEGYTFLEGTTFTEFVELVSQRTIPPSYGAPSMTISSNPAPGNFEVGTIINPIISRVFTQADAGAENATTLSKNSVLIASAYPYTDTGVTLGTSAVTYTGNTSYDEGDCKLDNRGNVDCTGRIAAGSVASNSIVFNATRVAFFGVPVATPATSAAVRALGNTSFSSSNNTTVDASGIALGGSVSPNFTITIPSGATRVVFAYPDTSRAVASVRYQELSDSEVKLNFVQTTVSVEGANSFAAVNYRVYTYIPVEPFSQTVHYRVFI